MKKKFLLLTLVALSFMGFKSAPKEKATTSKLDYYTDLLYKKNYYTPVGSPNTTVSDSFTSGNWTANSIVAESSLGQFWLLFQPDGNLVLYCKFPIYQALWASGPLSSNPKNVVFTSQGTVYAWNTNDISYWHAFANSCSPFFDYYWVLQDDGNFVCYDTTCSSSKSTRTHGGQSSLNWGSFQ